MAVRVRMPPLGQTSDEIRIAAWLKAVGDEVAEGEPLLEVETDKATLEVEAATGGVLLATLFDADAVVTAGDLIAWIGAAGEQIPADAEPVAPAPASGTPVALAPAPPALATPVPATPVPATPAPASAVLATPVVRALAREHSVDLQQLRGSGPGGRIERADVLAALAAPEAAGTTSGHRRAVAARLTRAAAVPQFSLATTVDCTTALAVVAEHDGASISHLLLQALGGALRAHPRLNSVWDETAGTARVLDGVRVGLAVAADDRLLVPTFADPDLAPLPELAAAVRAAVDEARAGKIRAEHQRPAAGTVSNLGMFGVDWFEAIVDPDQSSILAAGTVLRRPAVVDDDVVALPQLSLVLTVDHRVADGAAAARFLQAVKTALE